eukprot:3630242-Pleurochrysis_carterae.AAC.1
MKVKGRSYAERVSAIGGATAATSRIGMVCSVFSSPKRRASACLTTPLFDAKEHSHVETRRRDQTGQATRLQIPHRNLKCVETTKVPGMT